ncbi:MAG: S9 family peptidase [Aquimonas sp.]|nr:S9 family peptidase [Aquimonas sp.]
MLRHLFAVGFMAAALPALAQDSALEPFTIERSWQIQRIGSPVVSPDGRRIVAPVTRFDMAEDRGHTDLWMWNADGSGQRAFTTHASSEGAPAFSPDGRQLVFVAQREGDRAPQLYVMPIEGGEAIRLTQLATGVQSPKWFADGSRLAFVSRVFADLPLDEQGKRLDERSSSKMTARVFDDTVTAWDQYLDERQFHVFSVPAAGGEVVALTLPTGLQLPRSAVQGTDSLFDLSPDGRELAFVADSDPAPERADNDLFLLSLADGSLRNLTEGNIGNDGNPLYSPDGRHLAFVQQRIPGFYADRGRMMLKDRRSGAVRELYTDFDRSMSGLVWAADSRRLFGAIDDAGTVRAYALPLDGGPRALTTSPSFGSLAVGGSVLVGLRQSFVEPPTLVSIDPRTGRDQKLSTINDELLAGTALGTYESVTYTGANGAEIQMWVNYPPGFDRTKKYPFFMLIHGGPHNAITDGMAFRWNAQVFGSWGYVTAWPNFHGSSGFGQEFTDSINPNWADKPFEDVIKAAEWFAAQDWIDSGRMVAGGGSYGGYLSTIILGREHPFRALVAHAKVYNLYTQYAADFATQLPRFGGFWEPETAETIRHISPHYHAANFKTPTLVVHGQLDYRVPVNHGQELYQTLLMKGVPTRYVYFPNENHWILKPQNSVFWYQQVRRWFEEHGGLQPAAAAE